MSIRDANFAIRDREGDEHRPRLVKSAILTAYASAARSLGLDPYHMLRRAGLPVTVLEQPDHRISADRLQVLLGDSARAAACEEFGLLVGREFKLSMMGPLGLLVREQQTLGDALDALKRYLRYHDENVVIRTSATAEGLVLTPELLSARTRSSRQMSDLTMAMIARVVRSLVGEDWRPSRATFSHAAPHDATPYEQLFGPAQFRAVSTGLLLAAADLARPLPDADPAMAQEIARYIEASVRPQSVRMSETVRDLVGQLLPEGDCSLDRVAQHLGVDRRTVHRRLAAEGLSFSQIVETRRREAAAWRLENGEEPLGQVAAMLGFASLSTFSRWFRQAFGVQPSEYRRLSRGP